MISDFRLQQLQSLIASNREFLFYSWPERRALRPQVLRMDHFECQVCKRSRRYSAAKLVHHVKHLKERPDLALSVWDGAERQLISVCKSCHEKLHPESQRQYAKPTKPLTPERWD